MTTQRVFDIARPRRVGTVIATVTDVPDTTLVRWDDSAEPELIETVFIEPVPYPYNTAD